MLKDRARCVAIAVTARHNDAEIPATQRYRKAAGQVARKIDRKFTPALDDNVAAGHELRCDCLRIDRAGTDPLSACEEGRQRRRNITFAVVEAAIVALAAVIGVAEVARRLAVAADTRAPRQERFFRNRRCRQVDDAATEFAGIIDRVAFLDKRRCDHAGRKDIKRYYTPQRLGTGQRRSVEQRQRVPVTQPTHKDETTANDTQARDPGQRTGNITFAGPCNFSSTQHR